jgi:hypothetical protein
MFLFFSSVFCLKQAAVIERWRASRGVMRSLISIPDLVSFLGQRGESASSYSRDRHLESHSEAIIKLLRANNAISAGVHHEATQAGVSWVLRVELWQEVRVVDGDNAGDVILAFQSCDLTEHGLLVLLHGLVDYTGQNIHVTLSATKGHLSLDQFNQALNEQVLE